MRYVLLISATLAALVIVMLAVTRHPVQAKPGYVYVEKVHDGDTIEAEIDGRSEKIRLLGIDTPETVDPRRPVQCFGQEASHRSRELMTHRYVRVVADQARGAASDRDKYHRLLRYVYLEDGTEVNLALVRDGYAHEYTYQSQSYEHQAAYKMAQREAREESRGLWSASTCRGDTKQAA